MVQLVLGWKSHQITATPELIYCGASGDEAIQAIAATAGKGYVRAQRIVNPIGIPVALPDNHPAEAIAVAEVAATEDVAVAEVAATEDANTKKKKKK